MKVLHLMRHAKSSWNKPEQADLDRGLNKRGKRDAPRMGEALSRRMAPMSVAVSPARRAQLTLAGLCDGWPALRKQRHCTEANLYTFSADDLLEWIAVQGDDRRRLFLIGHNPALTDLVNYVIGEGDLDNLPTAGYVELALAIDHWRDLRAACGLMPYSLFPKQLDDS